MVILAPMTIFLVCHSPGLLCRNLTLQLVIPAPVTTFDVSLIRTFIENHPVPVVLTPVTLKCVTTPLGHTSTSRLMLRWYYPQFHNSVNGESWIGAQGLEFYNRNKITIQGPKYYTGYVKQVTWEFLVSASTK
jgi:hypothetical protein